MIPPSSRCKAYLVYSLFRCEFEVVFAWIVKKKSFSGPDFVDSEIWDLSTDLFERIFIKEFSFCLKNGMCQIVKRVSLLFK